MTKEQQKQMSDRIKSCREGLGFTQEQFAEMVALSASSYTKIENAFQMPRLSTLMLISEKLHLSLDYIVYGNTEHIPSLTDIQTAVFDYADVSKLKHARDVLDKIIASKGEK